MSAGQPVAKAEDRRHMLTNNLGSHYAARCSCGNLGFRIKGANFGSDGMSYESMNCGQCGKPAVVTLEPRS